MPSGKHQPVSALALSVFLVLAIQPIGQARSEERSVTDEIIKMLEAEMPEEVIVEWLEGASVAVAPLAADQLVALKKAGASTDLLKAILEWSRRPPPEPEATVALSSVPDSPALDLNGRVPVTFEISYLARFEDPDPEFDMFVYLDGVPVTYITTNQVEMRANRMEFSWPLRPGEHVLRITQERHFKSLAGKRWSHETRVAAEDFAFELRPGEPASIRVDFIERVMEWHDPLTFGLSQGERVVDQGPMGGEAQFWPLLCEDIEASVPEGKKPGRNQRKRLENCVRWQTLWGDAKAPERKEILRAMAEFDFQPVPRAS